MHSSLQALAGEVARLRSECTYFLRALDELERFSAHAPYVTDEQDNEIGSSIGVYAHSVQDNLERATDDVRNWTYVVDALSMAAAGMKKSARRLLCRSRVTPLIQVSAIVAVCRPTQRRTHRAGR